MKTIKGAAAAALAVGLMTIAACSGGPGGNTNEPVGVVNAAIAAAESGGFAKLAEYSCAANQEDFSSAFGGGDLGDLEGTGINPDELFDAMKIDFQDVTASETSKSGSEATVHITGTMSMTFDEAKMREIMKKALEAQGVPTSDATIDMAMTAMTGQLSASQDISSDLHVIQENGKWVICE